MGLESWLRPSRTKLVSNGASDDMSTVPPSSSEIPTSPYAVTGVVKARASTSNVSSSFLRVRDHLGKGLNSPSPPPLYLTQDIALLWEGRLKNVLVGLGVASNLPSGAKPVNLFRLELSYFIQDSRDAHRNVRGAARWLYCSCSLCDYIFQFFLKKRNIKHVPICGGNQSTSATSHREQHICQTLLPVLRPYTGVRRTAPLGRHSVRAQCTQPLTESECHRTTHRTTL
jgi:hypothetical protein